MRTCLLFLLLASTVTLRAEIEFSGFFITPQHALFSLTDTRDQRSSGFAGNLTHHVFGNCSSLKDPSPVAEAYRGVDLASRQLGHLGRLTRDCEAFRPRERRCFIRRSPTEGKDVLPEFLW